MFETIHFKVQESTAWLTLNRPNQLNALNNSMINELRQAIRSAVKDVNVRCVVLTGAGRAFCAGQDLATVNEQMDHGEVLRKAYVPLLLEMRRCEKPLIAALNGVAAGSGFSLALACDFRLMVEQANCVNAFIHVGLIPDAGNLYFLSQIVGKAKAIELSILGKKVTAKEALELGLATKVMKETEWQEGVESFATKIAALPTKAIGLTKRLLNDVEHLSFEQFLQREAEGQRIAGLTADHIEGVTAFKEKRKPVFIGQ